VNRGYATNEILYTGVIDHEVLISEAAPAARGGENWDLVQQ
jgi:hypothetical protein